ncbi:trafficking kinesin-binding protein milt isoform X1 [Orussus abietinus]|uniref:trafficking kinesin-binding protein milt isoform X1 n=2 Tax=Orussus abietinus TaxID=222816 RepID=UPI000C716144|nr:trafficking kinesin-binding protein milt isoform X1 [Orussus abietinus]XP_023288263.1 trafficking kinesin-binding protein milt isoform X1 [Orussus abietinus]XP_023288264.1 trafficking kinesin-binding protein milt isoform X1 [Orussus abietinus]XP_023288265.1 trafficking kinesin-binding protein milt isoform X1 [Orussus abietinus]XP_023288266.1 trafficking kinesin-binding protein milt isoform X1 [Orussus abietinus]
MTSNDPGHFSKQEKSPNGLGRTARSQSSSIVFKDSSFSSLALDVSYASEDSSFQSPGTSSRKDGTWRGGRDEESDPELWEDHGVVDYLEGRMYPPDESTPEEREDALREVLAETDIHEGDGDLSDFLFHVARTKYGRIYIKVIRTLLLNRVLCSNRVSQMTKTYNDIEAVTRLLEEKEKDLELTARIGKELLSHNQKLETNVSALETELKSANEKITQLSHELIKKTELIQVLTNDVDESGSEGGTPTGMRGINLDMMQRRISSLEDENKQLRTEFSKLVHDADDCEEQEARLVKDIAAQLANANMEVDGIAEELGRQKEENRLQHEQIVSLTAKLAETELRLAQLMAEHDEVGATLVITRDNQNTLATELAEFKDRYAEVVALLAETQEQLRTQRKRGLPIVRGGTLFPSLSTVAQPDSIASELESSLYSELSLDSGISTDRTPTYKKVFETVRSASRTSYAGTADANQFPRLGMMTTSTLSGGSAGPRMSCGPLRPRASSGFPSLDSTGHSDSEGSLLTDGEEYPGPQQTGVPGAPGAADLEAALRRLTPAEVIARRACLSTGAGYNFDYDTGIQTPPTFLPFGCRTPDSIMSTGSSGNLSGFSANSGSNGWRIPEKLQIIKPMEGSQTLHHWSQLATPTLGGLLEERPGVKTRGGRGLEDLGLETFTLADLEEDEEYANPGKLFQDTGSVYTYTNSTVMHPDDHTLITPSVSGSRVASAPSSQLNSGMNTPRTLSRRNSTSTFSTTLGLAKMLNERGIKAVTPSCVATPTGERNFTPTATPCNSPDGSPTPSRSTSPPRDRDSGGSPLSLSLFSSGAELLKRTFGSEAPVQKRKRTKPALSRSDKKALTGIRLVEKLERIGIDTIMATTSSSSMSPLALQGALYTRRSTDSPMTQLTFLKTSISSSISQEKLVSPSSSSSVSETSSSKPPLPPGKQKAEGRDSDLGVPSRPGSGALSSRLAARQRRSGAGATRPDLGQVKSAVSTPDTKETTTQSALGTISSLLFGRKGGLL